MCMQSFLSTNCTNRRNQLTLLIHQTKDMVDHFDTIKDCIYFTVTVVLVSSAIGRKPGVIISEYGGNSLVFLQLQVIAALRLIIDPGLHFMGNVRRDTVLEYLSKYAWEDTDVAQKEVRKDFL